MNVDPCPVADVVRAILDRMAPVAYHTLCISAGLRNGGLSFAERVVPVYVFDRAANANCGGVIVADFRLHATFAAIGIDVYITLCGRRLGLLSPGTGCGADSNPNPKRHNSRFEHATTLHGFHVLDLLGVLSGRLVDHRLIGSII
jgi:hypothetical protein